MCKLELKANFLGREREKNYWLGVGRPPPLTTINDIVCPQRDKIIFYRDGRKDVSGRQ